MPVDRSLAGLLATRRSPAPDDIEAAEVPSGARGGAAVAVGLTLLALLPVLATVVTRTGTDHLPVQDLAVIDLRVRDVWSTNVPLAGAYSRFGWAHPGPFLFWAIAPVSLLAGQAAWATLVGAALLQGAALAWGARLAWRRGGVALVLGWLVLVALAYGATGPRFLLEPWNPHVAYAFFLLLLLYGWVIVSGAHPHLLGITVVASCLVQLHVGYVPLAAVVGGAAAITVIRQRRRRGASLLDVVRAPLLAAAVLWLPVAVDAVLDPPGNLARIVGYFLGGGSGEEIVGLGTAAGLLAAEYQPVPAWLGGGERLVGLPPAAVPASTLWLAVPLVLLTAAWVVARRAADPVGQRLVVMVGVLNVVGVAALTRVVGAPEPYLFYWRTPVATVTVLAVAWVVGRHLAGASARSRAPAAVAAGAAAVAAVAWPSLALAVEVVQHPAAVHDLEPVAVDILDQLDDRPFPDGTLLLRFAGSPLGGLQAGLFDELDRRGVDVRFHQGHPFQFGRQRVVAPEQADTTWLVVEEGRYLSFLSGLPGATVLARTGALSDAEEAELASLQREAAERLVEAGLADLVPELDNLLVGYTLGGEGVGLDDDALARMGELTTKAVEEGVCRCAVVEYPLGARSPGSLVPAGS